MTARQALDHAVKTITGRDIRLVGNWSRPWNLETYSRELAAAIRVDEVDLLQCRDITDILNLMGDKCYGLSLQNQQSLALYR